MSRQPQQPSTPDEILAAAYRRAEERARDCVARGELVPLEVLAQRMRTTHESITDSVWAGRLFSVPVGERVFFPVFFAEPGVARDDLEFVIPGLASREPWSKFMFFTTGKASLGDSTPIDALKRGMRDCVRRMALAFNES